jgi:ketosteroid isomerase-like protein
VTIRLVTAERPDYYGNPAGLTDDVDTVKAIFAAFAARDLDAALRHVAPDCELHLEGTARAAGRTEPYRGHAGLREYFADVGRVWEELAIAATDYRVVPGSVVVMGSVSGRRDGEPVRRSALWTWKVRDGLATHIRVTDTGPR